MFSDWAAAPASPAGEVLHLHAVDLRVQVPAVARGCADEHDDDDPDGEEAQPIRRFALPCGFGAA